jgi:hypothetical protein
MLTAELYNQVQRHIAISTEGKEFNFSNTELQYILYHLEDLCVYGRILLKLIFQDWDGEVWTGLIWLRYFEYGTEHSGSIKCGEFLDYLRTCKLLRKDSAPWSQVVSTVCCTPSWLNLIASITYNCDCVLWPWE